jgi:hypothetical protein
MRIEGSTNTAAESLQGRSLLTFGPICREFGAPLRQPGSTTRMSSFHSVQDTTSIGFLSTMSVKTRVYSGFGLVILMLIALAGVSAVQ